MKVYNLFRSLIIAIRGARIEVGDLVDLDLRSVAFEALRLLWISKSRIALVQADCHHDFSQCLHVQFLLPLLFEGPWRQLFPRLLFNHVADLVANVTRLLRYFLFLHLFLFTLWHGLLTLIFLLVQFQFVKFDIHLYLFQVHKVIDCTFGVTFPSKFHYFFHAVTLVWRHYFQKVGEVYFVCCKFAFSNCRIVEFESSWIDSCEEVFADPLVARFDAYLKSLESIWDVAVIHELVEGAWARGAAGQWSTIVGFVPQPQWFSLFSELVRVALVFKQSQLVAWFRLHKVAGALDDHVTFVQWLAFLEDIGPWIEYLFGDQVVEFGFQALREVVEPVVVLEEVGFLLILSSVC